MHIPVELLIACNNNERKAQKELYETCYKVFMPLCMKYNTNAEDARSAYNIAFLKIIQGLAQVDIEQVKFMAWSKRIVTNTLIDEYRKQRLHQAHYSARETDRELEIHAENTTNEAESNFGYAQLLKLIDEIPETHALVFRMYVFEGLSHKEIATNLSMTEGTSKWHLSTARKLLKEKVEKLENSVIIKQVV